MAFSLNHNVNKKKKKNSAFRTKQMDWAATSQVIKQPSGMYKYGKCIEQGNTERINIAQTIDKMVVLRAKVTPGPWGAL